MRDEKKKAYQTASGKRFEMGFQILNGWLHLRQNGKTLIPFFEDNLIESIAVYGMGALGGRLYEELQNSRISVKYAIDRDAASKSMPGLTIYSPNVSVLPEADAIIVTPVQEYWTIVRMLEMKTRMAIVSLRDIIEYCMAGE